MQLQRAVDHNGQPLPSPGTSSRTQLLGKGEGTKEWESVVWKHNIKPSTSTIRKPEGEKVEFATHSLDGDTNSLFLVRVCMLFSPVLSEELLEQKKDTDVMAWERVYMYLSCAYAILLQFVNAVIQLGITYIMLLDVEKEENSWESEYFQGHYNMTLAGAVEMLAAAPSPFEDPNVADSIPRGIFGKCQEQTEYGLRHLSFYYFMIFVWVAKMFSELENCVVNALRVWKIATPGEGEFFSCFDRRVDAKTVGDEMSRCMSYDDMSPRREADVGFNLDMSVATEQITRKKGDDDRSFNIIYLTLWMKILLTVSVLFLRLFIGFMITYAGAKFIMLQRSYEKVVLKALCMQWVIQIDEVLVKSFSTHATKELIGKVKLYHQKFISKAWWEHCAGGPVLFCMGSLGVAIVTRVLFGDLMAFRSECLRVTGVGYQMAPLQEFAHEIYGLFH